MTTAIRASSSVTAACAAAMSSGGGWVAGGVDPGAPGMAAQSRPGRPIPSDRGPPVDVPACPRGGAGTPGDGMVAPGGGRHERPRGGATRAQGHHRHPLAGVPPGAGGRSGSPARSRTPPTCRGSGSTSTAFSATRPCCRPASWPRPPLRMPRAWSASACSPTSRTTPPSTSSGPVRPRRTRSTCRPSCSGPRPTEPGSTGSASRPSATAARAPDDDISDGRDRTFLPYLPAGTPGEIKTALVLPIRHYLPYAENGSLEGLEHWARTLSLGGRLRDLVDFATSAGSTPVTWLVDPAVPDAVRRLARGNPPLFLGPSAEPPTDEVNRTRARAATPRRARTPRPRRPRGARAHRRGAGRPGGRDSPGSTGSGRPSRETRCSACRTATSTWPRPRSSRPSSTPWPAIARAPSWPRAA